MDIGLVLPTEWASNRDDTEAWAKVTQWAQRAEDAELDSLWVGEHHFMNHTYFDNLQALSFLAGITQTITLGTAVCLAPLHNPIHLAERVANLDVQSGGRTVLGVGIGSRQKEFEVFGIEKSHRVPRLLETIDLLRRCWRDDAFSFGGNKFSFNNISVNPKPRQDGGPSIWLGGKPPAALRRAARLGDAWLPAPTYSWDDLEECYAVYDEALNGKPIERPVWREIFVAPTHDEAIESAKRPLVEKYDDYTTWRNGSANHTSKSVDDRFDRYREERFLIGTPAEVIEDIEKYRERFGIDHLLVRTRWPGLDENAAERSLTLILNEVAPEFK